MLCIVSIIVYVTYFLVRHKVVPPSLSQTAEYPGCYYFFQTVICVIFGFLQFYYPTIYPFSEYGYSVLLLSAGCAGLSLSGYFSYTPWDESKRDLPIHKYGSLAGGAVLMTFYAIFMGMWLPVLASVASCVILGLIVKGHRYKSEVGNSVTFWVEMCIVAAISIDLVYRFICMVR